MLEWIVSSLDKFTYIGVALFLFVAGLGVPIPEDIPLIFGGAMAAQGKINVWIHLAISMTFILIGDSCLYAIGRKIGGNPNGTGFFSRLLTPQRRAKAEGYFERFGSWTVFFARFIAGVRGAIYLTSGVVGFPYWRFLLLDFIAALVSVPVWIYLGWVFGENWEQILDHAKEAQLYIIGGLVLIFVIFFVVKRKRRRAAAASEQPPAVASEPGDPGASSPSDPADPR